MAAKDVRFGTAAREKMLRGMDVLADAGLGAVRSLFGATRRAAASAARAHVTS
jgi:hypothetical protein